MFAEKNLAVYRENAVYVHFLNDDWWIARHPYALHDKEEIKLKIWKCEGVKK